MIILETYIQGLLIGFALIAAIGAQNAFVIRQGILRQSHLLVAIACGVCDAMLIVLGVFGLSTISGIIPGLEQILLVGGLVFLLWYGIRSVISAFKSQESLEISNKEQSVSKPKILATAMAFSLLNPHAILDTVVLIGGYSVTYEMKEKIPYMFGAVSASLCWFLFLALGASRFSKVLSRPKAWRAVEMITGLIMLFLAFNLIQKNWLS